MKNVIVGTAGHIDHGKSTLIRALTGIDTDRLREEKERGITIDIGFAHMRWEDLQVGFIDVPGHEKFVKNMLAGIGGVHLMLLVVAADESIMPQTREHFDICRLLGISRGMVALTKSDLVEEELLELVEAEVRDLAEGTFLEEAPVIPVDSLSGRGLNELRAQLEKEARAVDQAALEFRQSKRVFSLPVDRVFTIRGFGTVVTGTALTGSVGEDEILAALPGRKETKIRGIEIFGHPANRAWAGQRAALNLAGMSKGDLSRGMFLTRPGTLHSSRVIDATVSLLSSSPASLKRATPVRFHHGSAEIIGKVYPLEGEEIEPGQTGLIQIRLEEQTVPVPGDRFILRRYSPLVTIGGGMVLNGSSRPHRKRELQSLTGRLKNLRRILSSSSADEASRAILHFFTEEEGASGVSLDELVSLTGLHEDYIREVLPGTELRLIEVQAAPIVVERQALGKLRSELEKALKEHHDARPLSPGMAREELRERLLKRSSPAYFNFLLGELEGEGLLELRGSAVALAGSRAELQAAQKEIRSQILELVGSEGYQPSSLEELRSKIRSDPQKIDEVFFFLVQQGELVKITEELVLSPGQIEALTGLLRREYRPGEPFAVPQFKDLIGLSRKYAIPILEFLDRKKITRREGEGRVLI